MMEAKGLSGEEWLYVAETTGKCVSRLKVADDGSLSGRETYGPSNLGAGVIDGICFDAYGNLWATMIFADRLVAITPKGDLLDIAEFEHAFHSGGPDLRTIYLGSLRGNTLPCFVSPVAGLPMVHW